MDPVRLLDGRLKLRHLILVDALTEHGSVVAAATALHITQPVASRGLHDIETILGVPLYVRGPRGVTPTEFGVAFTDHARSVLAQLTQAARHVEEIRDASRGRVVVGSHLAGSNLLLPRAIAHLKRDRPLLQIVVREASPESLLTDLAAGRVDLLVGRITGPGTEGTTRVRLYQEPIRVVAGAHHRLAGQSSVTLAELMELPWILPSAETRLRQEIEDFFAGHGFDLPADRVETSSFLTTRQLLIDTDIIATLPHLIATNDALLCPLAFSLEPIGRSVGMTIAAHRQLSPAAQALFDSLGAVAAELEMGGTAK